MFKINSIQIINKISRNINFLINNSISSNFYFRCSTFNIYNIFNSHLQKNFFNSSNNIQNDEKLEWRQRIVGAQRPSNLKVGPYKRGKWFVSFKDDPGSFITNILIILVTGYAIFTLLPGESMKVRRQRKLRQMLLDKANLTESELNYIENYKLDTNIENKENLN